MKNINFGLKLWSTNVGLLTQARQLIDNKIFNYIELFIVPNTKISPFVIDVPYIIHMPHHKFGVNIGESRLKKYNLEKINDSISWADKLDAKYIILHAGNGSMKSAENLLSEVIDNRLIIENMPKVGIDNEKMIGYSPTQIRELICNDKGLCLDFGHAAKTAVSLGLEYKEYINIFLEFYPKVFHISDGTLKSEKDEHLNIGEGEFDFEYLLKCIKKNHSKLATVETPRIEQRSLDSDILNVKLLKDNIISLERKMNKKD